MLQGLSWREFRKAWLHCQSLCLPCQSDEHNQTINNFSQLWKIMELTQLTHCTHTTKGLPKRVEDRKLVHPNTFQLMVVLYSPLFQSESLVLIQWCYQHVISNLKAAVGQPGRLLWQNGSFYDILLWLMRPFPLFHTHLLQARDSLSTTSPGSHHKTPAVVQLFTIAGNQQNQILGCCLSYVIWIFVFPFYMYVCSCHGTQDYSGSLHRSSQTEMIQQAISSSLPWTMLVGLQWTERHGPLLSVRVWAKVTHTWRMESCNSLCYHSTVVRSEEETYTSVLYADSNFPSFHL